MSAERPTILITGASSGLGAEMARQFADRGYDLALCARRTERLDELKAEIAEAHPTCRVEVRALDVLDDDAVFTVFRDFAETFGHLDRIVVNAGIGKGARLGTGKYWANRETAMTNFVAVIAQTEAALEIFRGQNAGHLVLISSLSALRGMPGAITTYAATKAGIAHLGEGVRMDVYGTPIKVSVIYPGYIRTELNEGARTPIMSETKAGVRSIVKAIVAEKKSARTPAWPWAPLGTLLKYLPIPLARKLI